jgi:hypothetical protein
LNFQSYVRKIVVYFITISEKVPPWFGQAGWPTGQGPLDRGEVISPEIDSDEEVGKKSVITTWWSRE